MSNDIKLVKTISELRQMRNTWRKNGLTVGFVPTMGYLHQGHQSLIETALKENNKVIVSDFLNPIQFGPSEDLSKYPRDLENDLKMVGDIGADVLFYPSANEMYGANFVSGLNDLKKVMTLVVPPANLTNKLCGAKRPGHFEGVCTVVAKLFNIVEPDTAYFGQKDFQQLRIIEQMVLDTNRSVKVVGCPTFREADGLAMSSRNVYLNTNERKAALILYKALELAKELIEGGEKSGAKITQKLTELISKEPLATIDYVSVVSPETLEDVREISNNVLVALAVFIGEDIHRTRLIDNCVIAL